MQKGKKKLCFEPEDSHTCRSDPWAWLPLLLMLTNYLRFLRAPPYNDQNQPVRWGELVILLLSYVALGFALIPLLEALVNYLQLKHALEDPDTTLILLGVLVVPPIEEVVFRLWLRVNRSTLFAVAFLVLFVGVLLLPVSNLGAVLLIALSVLILVTTLMGYDADIERVVARHFGFFFYGSTALFALAHITNYEPLNTETLLLAPVLVFPQFIVGTMLGYIRVRYGIGYSILFHVVVNAIFFLLAHFFPS